MVVQTECAAPSLYYRLNGRPPACTLRPPMKKRWIFVLVLLPFLVALDHPRRQVPAVWSSGLSPLTGAEFRIERQQDLTLKYVRVPVDPKMLEVVPVMSYRESRVRSVDAIAAAFSGETRRPVLAAVNGGFFDMATGLPIGFLMRDGEMEFFNMPQGFPRSMVGFGRAISILSPKEMPKVYLYSGRTRIGVHSINVPGGKNAFGVFTPRYDAPLSRPASSIYLLARRDGATPRRYRIVRALQDVRLRIPADHLVIAMHGASRGYQSALEPGTAVRLEWVLPGRWRNERITHGLVAGPRLLERSRIRVTADEERLARLKSSDRVSLGVKPDGEAIFLWAHQEKGNLTYERVAAVLAAMGASDAIALDGGRSHAILAQAHAPYPQDRYFEGGRPVANALLVALHRGETGAKR